uniref:NAD(P)(+)--arginine ADP-ribosyltransferase n=1 Tax=Monopterus albus TaxID=43700 RepID=A0A3Q3JNP0_MONAL
MYSTVRCTVMANTICKYYIVKIWIFPKCIHCKYKNNTDGLPLDMATESIDDMYDGCRSEAASMIDQVGVFEWHFNQAFDFYWASAERVIYMYTKVKYIQQTFNKAVITGKHKYSTNKFKFHYFYFYLVDAIQILHHKHKPCRTTYHRTWRHYNHNVIDTNMRFGGFILTGLTKQSSVFNGNVSCFEIQTCFGADVAYYSATKQMGQVLIPPYEVFRITDVLTSDSWCRVVYIQSTKIPRTDLNCKLNHNEISTYLGGDKDSPERSLFNLII